MEAKVTISRQNHSHKDDSIAISIDDANSGLNIVKVDLELSIFAAAITGLGFVSAEIQRKPTMNMVENLGKTREVKPLFVEKNNLYGDEGKELTKKRIEEELRVNPEFAGCKLHDSGLTSQQNGTMHRASVCRYVLL